MANTKDYLIEDLNKQGKFLNAYLDSRVYEKPTNLEILLLQKPSSEKYVIFRTLWDYGFNPTQKDWIYNYIFLSRHLAEKTNRDLTLNLHELFYILKNEESFDLLDESGKFHSEDLQKLYSEASTILFHLKATLQRVNK